MSIQVLTVIGIWFGGLATAGAVTGALWVAHRNWQRADAEQQDQRKAQARLVVSQVRPDGCKRVGVVNHSTAPVFDVEPEYAVNGREDGLSGQVSATTAMMEVPRAVLPPGQEWVIEVMYLDASGAIYGTSDYFLGQTDTITIAFTDSNGLRWRRVNNSEPERVIRS